MAALADRESLYIFLEFREFWVVLVAAAAAKPTKCLCHNVLAFWGVVIQRLTVDEARGVDHSPHNTSSPLHCVWEEVLSLL